MCIRDRYLDAQQGDRWLTAAALLNVLVATDRNIDAVIDVCSAVAGRWLEAARDGLRDPVIAAAARAVIEIGGTALADAGLTNELATSVANDLDRLSHDAGGANRT